MLNRREGRVFNHIPWKAHHVFYCCGTATSGDFTKKVNELGIREVLGALRAPQPRAYLKRVIGTIRHFSLEKDTPESRPVELPESGRDSGRKLVGCLIGTNVAAPEVYWDVEWRGSNPLPHIHRAPFL